MLGAPLSEIGAAVVDRACIEVSTVTAVCVKFGTVDVVNGGRFVAAASVLDGVVVVVISAGVGAESVAVG